MVGIAQGLFKKNGVNITTVAVQQAQVLPSVASGSADFGFASTESVWDAQAKGSDIKLVAAETTVGPFDLVVPKTITSVKDLIGKNLGDAATGVSADWQNDVIVLDHAGVKPTQVHFVVTGTPAGDIAGLTSGSVQAVSVFAPQATQLIAQGYHSLFTSRTLPALQHIIISGPVSSPSWYDSHHQAAVDFLKGYAAALQFMYTTSKKTTVVADIAKYEKITTTQAKEVYKWFIPNHIFSSTGIITNTDIQGQANNDRTAGVSGIPTTSELANSYDDSLIKAAQP